MSRIVEAWEIDLTPVHRALLSLCRERMTKLEWRTLEAMGEAQLAAMLCGFLRQEYVTIPAGTPVVPCGSCAALVCRVAFDDRHYRTAFVANGPECHAPTATRPGRGFDHVADCPGSGLVQMAQQRYRESSPAIAPAAAGEAA